MSGAWPETALAELARALVLYPGRRADVLDELRDHLLESRARHLRAGRTPAEAERVALADLGEPAQLARALIAQRGRARARKLLPLALVLGLALAWNDARPSWDDTGISALAVLACCGVLGLLGPDRVGLWALSVGAWFPLLALLQQRGPGAALALAFALAGALAGRVTRRVFLALRSPIGAP